MAVETSALGWEYVMDPSPEWLFVRLVRRWDDAQYDPEPGIANSVWSKAAAHGVNRIVFEFEENTPMSSFVIGQLILLHKRATLNDGVLRLCGLTDGQYHVLRLMLLDERFPNYGSREKAVLGRRPGPPEH